MKISSEVAQTRARIAGMRRQNPDANVAELQCELKTAVLANRIRQFVESAPVPTPEQLARLRALLVPSTGTRQEEAVT